MSARRLNEGCPHSMCGRRRAGGYGESGVSSSKEDWKAGAIASPNNHHRPRSLPITTQPIISQDEVQRNPVRRSRNNRKFASDTRE